jgi:hypothetical protein
MTCCCHPGHGVSTASLHTTEVIGEMSSLSSSSRPCAASSTRPSSSPDLGRSGEEPRLHRAGLAVLRECRLLQLRRIRHHHQLDAMVRAGQDVVDRERCELVEQRAIQSDLRDCKLATHHDTRSEYAGPTPASRKALLARASWPDDVLVVPEHACTPLLTLCACRRGTRWRASSIANSRSLTAPSWLPLGASRIRRSHEGPHRARHANPAGDGLPLLVVDVQRSISLDGATRHYISYLRIASQIVSTRAPRDHHAC